MYSSIRPPPSPPSRLYENLGKPTSQPLANNSATHYQRLLEFSRSSNVIHPHARIFNPSSPPPLFQNVPPLSENARDWSVLDVGGLSIRNLSPSLFRYTTLTALYLNNNNLSFIPQAISELANLAVLDLSANAITFLPAHLGLLYRLKELLLFDNHISTLPNELGFLFQLEILGLDGNPIPEPIPSLLMKEGTTGVISYLRDSCPGKSTYVFVFLISCSRRPAT